MNEIGARAGPAPRRKKGDSVGLHNLNPHVRDVQQ